MKLGIDLSDERKKVVYDNMCDGSDPRPAFFLLVATSTLIASFGLVMSSTAVIIGAMLVAPLMTPILGLGLALVRGDAYLVGLAARSESLGVVVSVVAATLLGLAIPTYFEPTPEMLSRTSPNLLDLLVAVFAGLAGAYALVDEKLSPVLPGVAIATAIVPPLANCGLCLALGAYEGALGSFLLFFTNFLSILLISALIFFLAGMTREIEDASGGTLARRLSVAFGGFLFVAIFLSYELLSMFEHRRLLRQIAQVLEEQLADTRVSSLDDFSYERVNEKLVVLAEVNAPDAIRPRTVESIEAHLADRLREPVELYIRTSLTSNVTATGSIRRSVAKTLDGHVIADPDPRITTVQNAEQVIREFLDERLGVYLRRLDVIPTDSLTIISGEIEGTRRLLLSEIGELEDQIKKRLENEEVSLVLDQDYSDWGDRFGLVRRPFQQLSQPEELIELNLQLGSMTRQWFEERQQWMVGWSTTLLDGVLYLLCEVTGPSMISAEDRNGLQEELNAAFDLPITVYVRTRLDTVVGPDGYSPLEVVLEEFRQRNLEAYGEQIKEITVQSR